MSNLVITEIACAYFNDYANPINVRKRFIRLLKSYPELWEELLGLGFRPYQRIFLPKQYDAVRHYLGEL